jgi:hypothetical protein
LRLDDFALDVIETPKPEPRIIRTVSINSEDVQYPIAAHLFADVMIAWPPQFVS